MSEKKRKPSAQGNRTAEPQHRPPRTVEAHIEHLFLLAEGRATTDGELERWLGVTSGSIAKWRSHNSVSVSQDDDVRRLRGPEAAFYPLSSVRRKWEEDAVLYSLFSQIIRQIGAYPAKFDAFVGERLLHLSVDLRRIINEIGMDRLSPDELWLLLSDRIDDEKYQEVSTEVEYIKSVIAAPKDNPA